MPLDATMYRRRAPAFFVGHGSPMIGIEENDLTRSLKVLGKNIDEPKAILVISAHWMPPFFGASVHHSPALLYDFFGFPEPLYHVQYPAPNAEFLTPQMKEIFPNLVIKERGLDHGSWTILKHLYPYANIPVMQLGIHRDLSLREHFEIGKRIRELREHGVMIIGSGNITHNLSRVDSNPDAPPHEWAIAFDTFIKESIEKMDIDSLIGFRDIAPYAEIAHPTLEHYIPLLYIAGTMYDDDDKSSFPYEGFSHGSLSMRNWLLNNAF
ncbi:MAG: class III extradiol ring-cleavage dioxygenase [Sulfuricurvum sp.]|uniref:dioxygenase family protein n=1 Tax=Sulfuricurvum sp. TaxID=2025608 RepID=UPI0026100E6A|nr:class III extradiol ring-cleavage dioxygenase [Sulfuricurvum sp.]MDD2829578.1 class III extradiol ring-cleavage dioxygenase [Sulfuricurvum sp.]MDD4950375.1 class III extradiol ring-cleavage dioxygenase [Sulfuricurvum sp.]